jgi:predicted nucleic acid-binding Zn ribbon protein
MKTARIDGVIKSVIEKLEKDPRPTSEDIGAAWKEAAGEKAARHTKPASLRKKNLVINVDGSSWLYELTLRKESLLAAMKKRLGGKKIKELQFRIGEL